MTFELRAIAPEQLHEYWEMIHDDLETCRKRETADCWMEDIYYTLRSGQAGLQVGFIDGAYAGFVIGFRKPDPWSGAPLYHVWFCNNHEGFSITAQGLQLIEDACRAQGVKKITMRAPPEAAFWRLMGQHGFEMTEVELVKEITNDG